MSAAAVAAVFPGQGSQSAGMLRAYSALPQVAAAVEEASAALGQDMAALIQDEAALNQTVNTQPAMLAVGVGVYRAAVAAGMPAPCVFAGHSLGEYAALVCANCIDFGEAVKLARARAELMQSAAPAGGMLAVLGLGAAAVEAVCEARRAAGGQIWAANYNTDSQIVIAGIKADLQAAAQPLREAGAKKTVLLAMSVPSHCPLLREAAESFVATLRGATWRAACAPVLHNAGFAAAAGEAAQEFLPRVLAAQLFCPVRWQEALAGMAANGATCVYECGPGRALAGMGKKSFLPHIALNDAEALQAAFAA